MIKMSLLKKNFCFYITSYGGMMAFLFVFNLNLLQKDELNKELMTNQIKIDIIYNKIAKSIKKRL